MFATAVRETAPPSVDLQTEVVVSGGPQRVDLVIRRRADAPARNEKARSMRPLWPHLSDVTLVDYKSPSRGYRRTDLMRLCGYGLEYYVRYHVEQKLTDPGEITLALVVSQDGRALQQDAALLRLAWMELEPGYARLDGNTFPIYVVSAGEAAQATDDDWLRLLCAQPVHKRETVAWYDEWLVYYEQYAPEFAQREEFCI